MDRAKILIIDHLLGLLEPINFCLAPPGLPFFGVRPGPLTPLDGSSSVSVDPNSLFQAGSQKQDTYHRPSECRRSNIGQVLKQTRIRQEWAKRISAADGTICYLRRHWSAYGNSPVHTPLHEYSNDRERVREAENRQSDAERIACRSNDQY